jgi:hypothetical protein
MTNLNDEKIVLFGILNLRVFEDLVSLNNI